MKEFVKSRYERSDTDTSLRARTTSRDLPLWKMYRTGSSYVVPYTISSSIGAKGRVAIREAAVDLSSQSCIRLMPRESGQDQYIDFVSGHTCSSPVGAVSDRQQVTLGRHCWYKGTVIHEVLHSLGFWHEQSRPDRDRYVRVDMKNISPRLKFNFNKFSATQVQSWNSAYDVGSLMHYNSYAFSSNGKPTITDLEGNVLETQREELSQSDVRQLNKLYGCDELAERHVVVATQTTTAVERCSDKHEYCGDWAGSGECTSNPLYMEPNCCESCKRAAAGDRQLLAVTACVDAHPNCGTWASSGQCQLNPAYMTVSCCKSCTNPGVQVCEDKHVHCASWASLGYCASNAAYMRGSCRRSCRLC